MKLNIFPGWWQVVVAIVVQAISSASIFLSYSVIAVQLKETFNPSTMVLMLSVTLAIISGGVLGPLVGSAIDRLSIRRLMLTGSILVTCGFFLLSITTAMWQVLAIYMLVLAIGGSLIGQISTTALLARWFTRRRGLAMGIAVSGVAIGGIIIPPLLQFLIDTFEWRMALRVFACILFSITAPSILLLVIDRPSDRGLYPEGDKTPPEIETTPANSSIKSIIRSAPFWVVCIAIGTAFFGPFALISNMVPYTINNGFDARKGALLLSIYSGASFTGKLLYAAVGDRIDNRVTFVTILSILMVSMLLFIFGDSYANLVIACVLTGISSGAALPLRSVFIANMYGSVSLGRILGLVGLVTMPFTLIGPPLFGWSFDVTGSYNTVLTGYLVLLVCVTLLLLRTPLKPAQQKEEKIQTS